MKNKFAFFQFIILFLLFSCGDRHVDKKNVESNLVRVKVDSKIEENEEVMRIKLLHIDFPINVVYFKESDRAFIEVNDKFQNIELDLRDGSKEFIWLFKDQDKYILMFPTYTEEFFNPCIVRVSKNGQFEYLGDHKLSNEDFIESSKLKNGSYHLKEKDDTIRVFYSKQDREVMFSEVNFHSDMHERITLEETQILKSLTNKDKSSLIQRWKGNYTLELDLIREMTEHNWKFSLHIGDENDIFVHHKSDNGTESIENLVIKSNSTNELVLISPTDKNTEYILTLEGNNFYIAGFSIYLINPPNERYQVFKKPK